MLRRIYEYFAIGKELEKRTNTTDIATMVFYGDQFMLDFTRKIEELFMEQADRLSETLKRDTLARLLTSGTVPSVRMIPYLASYNIAGDSKPYGKEFSSAWLLKCMNMCIKGDQKEKNWKTLEASKAKDLETMRRKCQGQGAAAAAPEAGGKGGGGKGRRGDQPRATPNPNATAPAATETKPRGGPPVQQNQVKQIRQQSSEERHGWTSLAERLVTGNSYVSGSLSNNVIKATNACSSTTTKPSSSRRMKLTP